MQTFQLTVLGANSAVPLPHRFSSSFVVSYGGRHIMIDCGEGAQIKMNEYGIRPSKLDAVLISHMHGDHIFGLPGLLNSLSLNGRTAPLHIYGPTGLEEYITTVRRLSGSYSSYDVIIHEKNSDEPETIATEIGLRIDAFALRHRISTYGYRLTEPDMDDNINPKAIQEYGLSIAEIRAAKRGEAIYRDDRSLPRESIMLPSRAGRAMAYCSDTAYERSIIPHISGVELLYHEATFMQDRADKAVQHMHATTIEAATIARDAGVGRLLIGHYSSRYDDLGPYVAEARSIFSPTDAAISGEVYDIKSQ